MSARSDVQSLVRDPDIDAVEINTCEAGPTDAVEDYAGESGLQYLGDGNSQFSWKTLKDYAGQCRMLTLELSDGTTLTADFKFTN
jgi:hypothetical protein